MKRTSRPAPPTSRPRATRDLTPRPAPPTSPHRAAHSPAPHRAAHLLAPPRAAHLPAPRRPPSRLAPRRFTSRSAPPTSPPRAPPISPPRAPPRDLGLHFAAARYPSYALPTPTSRPARRWPCTALSTGRRSSPGA
nr:uncharacterized protein LOC127329071 [Lolium perenne]